MIQSNPILLNFIWFNWNLLWNSSAQSSIICLVSYCSRYAAFIELIHDPHQRTPNLATSYATSIVSSRKSGQSNQGCKHFDSIKRIINPFIRSMPIGNYWQGPGTSQQGLFMSIRNYVQGRSLPIRNDTQGWSLSITSSKKTNNYPMNKRNCLYVWLGDH